ncbi:30S ribosomal protein S2 [bacterium]|nr:30S ribosomal protein S2 [bacterium]
MKIEEKELLEAGIHFGHKAEKWHPKMKPFLFTKRSGIHIIDLEKTKEKLEVALDFIAKEAAEGKKVLFVGTKRQAQDIIKEEATRAGMPYVANRWLGGTLTNFRTVISQVKKLKSLEEGKKSGTWEKFSKKEQSMMKKELDRLTDTIGGISELTELPQVLFVVDITKEHIAIKEAKRMNIPVVAVVDSNANPHTVDYAIPGNDDAVKAIKYMVSKAADAVLEKATPVKKEDLEEVEK